MLLLIIKLLSREVVIFHIRIYKGAKRRSWRKTGLLLQTPHAFVLLGLTIAEVRHEPLKRMASVIHGTMTTATPTPTPSRGSS
jgi:Na+-transporting NADH:ubiquinone oxidoreductase subunit NqrD